MNTNIIRVVTAAGAFWAANILIGSAAWALSNKIINSFPAPSSHSYGLAYGDGVLFVSDHASKTIYRLNPDTGSVLSSYVPDRSPEGHVYGLGFYAGRLWADGVQPNDTRLYEMTPGNGSVLASYEVGGITSEDGIASHERYVYISNNSSTAYYIYMFDPASGTVVKSWCGAKFPGGLNVIKYPLNDTMLIMNLGTLDGYIVIFNLEGQLQQGMTFKIAPPCGSNYRGDLATRNDTDIFFVSDYLDTIFELRIDWTPGWPVEPASLGRVKALFR